MSATNWTGRPRSWRRCGSPSKFERMNGSNSKHRAITVTVPPPGLPSRFLRAEDQDRLVRALLVDETIPLDVRVAGLLVLLLAQPVTRIHHLTADAVHQRGDHTYLHLGDMHTQLPPPLAALIHRLLAQAILSQINGDGPRHLFPSKLLSSHPVTAATLTRRLNDHGITTLAGRNTALLALVTDLPAPVAATLAAIHINTATRWASHARRDWQHYLTARDPDLGQPAPAPRP